MPNETTRSCSTCNKTKPIHEFGFNGGWRRRQCRACLATTMYRWRVKNEHYSTIKRWTGKNQWIQQRAKKLGVAFDLDVHAPELEKRLAKMSCELTGIPLAYQRDDARLWNSPSLDRVVPEEGYVYDNVRIVAFGVNSLLGNWGEDDGYRIAKAFVAAFERDLEGV